MWLAGIVLGVAGAATGIEFESCTLEARGRPVSVDADCFEITVPVDRTDPDGETLTLSAARVPGTAREASKPPLLMLAGGPGQSALESFAPHVRALEPVRRDHAIILVDQRGTGESHPLDCPQDFDQMENTPAEAAAFTRRCLEALEADPRHFTTSAAVADLEAVREALGLEQWHVYGVSYGSRLALSYLRRHPDRVATMTLDGVVPADETLGPMIAPFAERAVRRMLDRCEESAACSEAFPSLEAGFDAMLAELDASPRQVSLRDPLTFEPRTVELDRARVAQVLRFAAYQPDLLSIMPLLIHRAANEDDWAPLAAQWLILGESMGDMLSLGLHYSVVCSEDVPFIDETGLGPANDSSEFFGTDPVELLRAACAEWPRGPVPDDFHEPVESDRPVLLLSGELDPVTPPEWADQAAATLANSRHLVLTGKGHNVVHLGCVPFLMRDFLAAGDPQSLETECLDDMRAMPFFLDFSGPKP